MSVCHNIDHFRLIRPYRTIGLFLTRRVCLYQKTRFPKEETGLEPLSNRVSSSKPGFFFHDRFRNG
jgi:hypothetical protein